MKLLLLSALICMKFHVLLGFNATVKVRITEIPISKQVNIYISTYKNDSWIVVDSTKLFYNKDSIEFGLNLESNALLQIDINEFNIELPLNKVSPIINLEASYNDITDGNYNILPSNEIISYLQLVDIYKKIQPIINELNIQKSEIQITDSFYNNKFFQIELTSAQVLFQMNNNINIIKQSYPNSMTALVFANLLYSQNRLFNDNSKKAFDNEIAFQHYHFWDSIPFTKAEIISHPIFRQKLSYYMQNFIVSNNEGIKSAINIIFNREMHPTVHDYLLRYFVNKLTEKEYFGIIKYLLEGYNKNGNQDPKTFLIQNEITNKLCPNIILNSNQKMEISLYKSVVNYKYTILWFWEPDCSHCLDFYDSLSKYANWLNKESVGLFSVVMSNSVNNNKTKNELLKFSNYTEVYETKGWKSPLIEQFNITRTPTIYIVDDNLNIINKQLDSESIIDEIKVLLNK